MKISVALTIAASVAGCWSAAAVLDDDAEKDTGSYEETDSGGDTETDRPCIAGDILVTGPEDLVLLGAATCIEGSLRFDNMEMDAVEHSNRIWFDDIVVSTAPIGCGE